MESDSDDPVYGSVVSRSIGYEGRTEDDTPRNETSSRAEAVPRYHQDSSPGSPLEMEQAVTRMENGSSPNREADAENDRKTGRQGRRPGERL